MARMPLQVAQFNPAAQEALRALNHALPDGFWVAGEAEDVFVAYPDHMGEAGARDEIRRALGSLPAQGGVSVPSS